MFGSGCVLNKKKEEELRQSIIRQYESLNKEKRKEISYSGEQDFALEFTAYAKSAVAQGQVLILLCENFTIGCLFWLQNTLTENFLKNRTTKSGIPYKDAIKELRRRELAGTAKKSGATELCDTVRAEHRRIYKVDEIAHDGFIE
ncbi:MAG: hypothetical protein OHK93_003339 [Ramalina farinacea]|uniref:Uncharacterized protein n=1 Tax=Ramalina farinacea TaxID=258253 RepID=A0AA43QTU9_9LECA|nr:hypothetical protein [Ramalina farinacea]